MDANIFLDSLRKKYKLKIFSENEISKILTFENKSANEITNYIVKHFHEGLRKTMPEINQLLLTIMRKHIKEHKSLFWKIHELFCKVKDLYESHLILEEENVFPCTVQLEENEISKNSDEYKKMIQGINEAENEHSIADPILEEIYLSTNGYSIPNHACDNVKFLYDKLKIFQDEVIAHTQLENIILFPRYLK